MFAPIDLLAALEGGLQQRVRLVELAQLLVNAAESLIQFRLHLGLAIEAARLLHARDRAG